MNPSGNLLKLKITFKITYFNVLKKTFAYLPIGFTLASITDKFLQFLIVSGISLKSFLLMSKFSRLIKFAMADGKI